MTKTEKSSIRQGTKAGLLHLLLEREKLSKVNLYTKGRAFQGEMISWSPLQGGVLRACTKTWNAGMPERRNTKTRNTKLLQPGTHEK